VNNHEAVLEFIEGREDGVLAKEISKAMPERFHNAHAVSFVLRSLEAKGKVFRERVVGTSYTRYKSMRYNPNHIINAIWRKDGGRTQGKG